MPTGHQTQSLKPPVGSVGHEPCRSWVSVLVVGESTPHQSWGMSPGREAPCAWGLLCAWGLQGSGSGGTAHSLFRGMKL